MAKFEIGKRVKIASGFAAEGGALIVPAAATAEILDVGHGTPQPYTIFTKWKLGDGTPAEWTGTVLEAQLVMATGRPMFPGEAPPKRGEQFGVTGQNNDYRKLAKQGRRAAPGGTVVTAVDQNGVTVQLDTATDTMVAVAAPKGTVVTETGLTSIQQLLLGTPCQTPKCSGTLVELQGKLKRGPEAGKPFHIVKCSVECGARVRRDGTFQAGTAGKKPFRANTGGVPTTQPSVPGSTLDLAAQRAAAQKAAVAAGNSPLASQMAAATATPLPSATAPGPVPGTVQAAPNPTPAAPSPKGKKAAASPAGFTFPTTLAMKLVADVRTMTKQGTTDMTFSLRKALSWGTASVAFSQNGVPEQEAIAAGFRLVAYDREVEESQGKLEQLFQSIFSFKPTLRSTHPATSHDAIIGMALQANLNLWLSGPTGCGKTYSVLHRLIDAKRPFIRIQGGGDVTRETLVGYAALENGTSTFKPGPLTTCIEKGWVLVVDEIDKLRDEVLSEMTAVLEGNALVLMDDGGRVVPAAEGFAVIATANTVGRGEGMMYGGTKTVNEALRDRFVFLNVDYDNQRDAKIVAARIHALGAGNA